MKKAEYSKGIGLLLAVAILIAILSACGKAPSIDEMKAILSSYDIPKENISVIPWQNPISSYLGEYWISLKDEDPDSVARRRQEYVDMLRDMLLDYEAAVTKDAYANWTENSRIISSCLNVVQTNHPEVGTSDMAGWFMIAEVLDKELESITDYDAKMVTETFELPEDFAFSIVWGCYGISSYDSITGKLVKTKDATDVSKYTSTALLTGDQMKEVYRILFSDIDFFEYPDSYDPFNAPDAEIRVASEPNQTIIISVTANGRTKTVTCNGVAFGSAGYCEEASAFMDAENKIVELITSLPEWAAFPEYEFFYE